MRILQFNSKNEAEAFVANHVYELCLENPKTFLGLATGKTMVGVYEKLLELYKERPFQVDQLLMTMLDEYLGLPEDHQDSFYTYIKNRVLGPLGLKKDQFIFPSTQLGNLNHAINEFEEKVRNRSVDLQLLGIGLNGHVGFNEPGSTKDSVTRIVELTMDTQKANNISVNKAISMGISTILNAKKIILLATGANKARIIKYLVQHDDVSGTPATFLKSHSHFTLVLDKEAASKINLSI